MQSRKTQEVERKTGMRCAVVCGRLPPEIKEQAALLNDPEMILWLGAMPL